mgnify:CR=1 FL=1
MLRELGNNLADGLYSNSKQSNPFTHKKLGCVLSDCLKQKILIIVSGISTNVIARFDGSQISNEEDDWVNSPMIKQRVLVENGLKVT